jgi:hypothetical protein
LPKRSNEQLVTIEVLHQRGQSVSKISRILGVTESYMWYPRLWSSAKRDYCAFVNWVRPAGCTGPERQQLVMCHPGHTAAKVRG